MLITSSASAPEYKIFSWTDEQQTMHPDVVIIFLLKFIMLYVFPLLTASQMHELNQQSIKANENYAPMNRSKCLGKVPGFMAI